MHAFSVSDKHVSASIIMDLISEHHPKCCEQEG